MLVATDRRLIPSHTPSVRYLRIVTDREGRPALLHLTCDPACHVSVLGAWPVEPLGPSQPFTLCVRLGAGLAAASAGVLAEVRIAGRASPGPVAIHCLLTGGDGAAMAPAVAMHWLVADTAASDTQQVDHDVVRAVVPVLAAMARERVARACSLGRHYDARAIVFEVSRHLRLLSGGSLEAEMAIATLHLLVDAGAADTPE